LEQLPSLGVKASNPGSTAMKKLIELLDDKDRIFFQQWTDANVAVFSSALLVEIGWVCENHPSKAWPETLGCMCGAGMPCRCNDVEQPDTSEVIEPHDQLLSSDFSDGDHLIRSQAPDGGSESFGTHASVKIAISSDPIGRVLSKWPSRSARPFGDSTQRGPLRRRG